MKLPALIPADDRQALRVRRFFMAAAVYGMAGLLMSLFAWQGFMQPAAAAGLVGAMLLVNLGFYAVLRLGINRHLADPSLTMAQIVVATFVLMASLYHMEQGRGALLLFYLVTFVFGVFRLNTEQFLSLNAFALLAYGGMIALLQLTVPDRVDLRLELVQWVALAFVLPSFALIGGHISAMRRKLRERNQELQLALQRIGEMALRDELTGAHNRRYILDLLEREKARVDRLGGVFSVALLDLDHFKRINDGHGHLAGDRVLQQVAERAQSGLRATDAFARYGGEEFLILMPRTNLDEARIMAERLRQELRQVASPELDAAVTASLGVTEYQPGESVDAVIDRADQALYRAKADGRDRVCVAEPARPREETAPV